MLKAETKSGIARFGRSRRAESGATPASGTTFPPMDSTNSGADKRTDQQRRTDYEQPGDGWLEQAALGDPMVTFDSDGRAYITNAERAEQFDRDGGGD